MTYAAELMGRPRRRPSRLRSPGWTSASPLPYDRRSRRAAIALAAAGAVSRSCRLCGFAFPPPAELDDTSYSEC